MAKRIMLLLMAAAMIFAADFTGTWKLNTAKSKYEGMPAPKEQTVVYAPQGSGWAYTAKGVTTTGEAINSSFTYVKDGEEIKATGFPNWDAMVIKGGKDAKSTVQLKRGGKAIGTAVRTISADGKTMTIAGNVTLTDGKKGTYNAVYEKQ